MRRQERSQQDQELTLLNRLMSNPTTFCIVLASYITAGLFGVAFVQTALQTPTVQHSGTQGYVRIVR